MLTGVDLHVPSGSFTALLGPSGCGKTTLLRLIAGFDDPDARHGRRRRPAWSPAPAAACPPAAAASASCPQEGGLFPHLTVAANVAFGLPRRQRRDRAPGRRRCSSSSGLAAELADRAPHQLSGGQQQRVALARALAPEPSLVLLDEPFSSLDAALREETRAAVAAALAAAGATTVLVTHDQAEALSMADQVAVMRGGRLVQLTDPRTLYRQPRDLDVATFVGEAVVLDADVRDGRAHCVAGRRSPLERAGRRRPGPRAAAARAAAARRATRPGAAPSGGPGPRRRLLRPRLPGLARPGRRAHRQRPARGRRRAGRRRRRVDRRAGHRRCPSRSPAAPGRRRVRRAAATRRCPSAPVRDAGGLSRMDLFLFTVDPAFGADVVAAGAAGVVVDWERRGKARRQAGEGTQINADTPDDLARMRAATDGRVLCRINGCGPWTPAEIDEAVAARRRRGPAADGAHARGGRPHPRRRRRPVRARHPRRDAGRRRARRASSPAVRCRGSTSGSTTCASTAGRTTSSPRWSTARSTRVRAAVPGRFGVGGLTLPGGGAPVPSTLLAAELVRAGRRLHLPAPVVHRRHGRPRPRSSRCRGCWRLARPARGRAGRLAAARRAGLRRRRDGRPAPARPTCAGRWLRRREGPGHRRRRVRRPAPGRPADRRRLGRRRADPAPTSTSPTPPRRPPPCAPPSRTSSSPWPRPGARPPPAERAATVAVNTSPWLVDALPDRCRAVVRLGSSTEYAAAPHPLAEDAALRPRGFFGATKAAGSLLLQAAAAERGVRSAVLRAFQVYGPGDHPTRLVPGRARRRPHGRGRAAAGPGQPAGLGVGRRRRRRLRAGGVADDLPGGTVLNIGTGVQTSTEELVATAARVTGRPIATVPGAHPGRAWDTADWVSDPRAAAAAARLAPTVDLAEGLARTWAARRMTAGRRRRPRVPQRGHPARRSPRGWPRRWPAGTGGCGWWSTPRPTAAPRWPGAGRGRPRVRVTVLPVNGGQHARAGPRAGRRGRRRRVGVPRRRPAGPARGRAGAARPAGRGRRGRGLRRPARAPTSRRCGGSPARLHRRVAARLTGLPPDAGAFLAMDRPVRAAVVTEVLAGRAPSVVLAVARAGRPRGQRARWSRDVRPEGRLGVDGGGAAAPVGALAGLGGAHPPPLTGQARAGRTSRRTTCSIEVERDRLVQREAQRALVAAVRGEGLLEPGVVATARVPGRRRCAASRRRSAPATSRRGSSSACE